MLKEGAEVFFGGGGLRQDGEVTATGRAKGRGR